LPSSSEIEVFNLEFLSAFYDKNRVVLFWATDAQHIICRCPEGASRFRTQEIAETRRGFINKEP